MTTDADISDHPKLQEAIRLLDQEDNLLGALGRAAQFRKNPDGKNVRVDTEHVGVVYVGEAVLEEETSAHLAVRITGAYFRALEPQFGQDPEMNVSTWELATQIRSNQKMMSMAERVGLDPQEDFDLDPDTLLLIEEFEDQPTADIAAQIKQQGGREPVLEGARAELQQLDQPGRQER